MVFCEPSELRWKHDGLSWWWFVAPLFDTLATKDFALSDHLSDCQHLPTRQISQRRLVLRLLLEHHSAGCLRRQSQSPHRPNGAQSCFPLYLRGHCQPHRRPRMPSWSALYRQPGQAGSFPYERLQWGGEDTITGARELTIDVSGDSCSAGHVDAAARTIRPGYGPYYRSRPRSTH